MKIYNNIIGKMVYSKELDKEFASKGEMFIALKENEKNLITLKKSNIYKSFDKGHISSKGFGFKNVEKTAPNSAKAVINTTYYLDSHQDVHLPGLWKKTISENKERINYMLNHSSSLNDVIVWGSDLKIYTKLINWSDVGKNYAGQTEGLIYEFEIRNVKHQKALEAIKEHRPLQNSVRMQYMDIALAINSNEYADLKYKQLYDEIYPLIVNKEVADESDYFWVIKQARIMGEGSLVLDASNDATSIIYEPQGSTQQKSLDYSTLIKKINNLKI